MKTQNHENDAPLSAEGAQRKQAIRDAASQATADRARGARIVKGFAVAVVPILIIAVIATQMTIGSGQSNEGVLAENDTNNTAVSGSNENTGDPENLTGSDESESPYQNLRFAVIESRPVTVRTIDDDELLALMAEAGRPAGLIRIGNHVRLVEHNGMVYHGSTRSLDQPDDAADQFVIPGGA